MAVQFQGMSGMVELGELQIDLRAFSIMQPWAWLIVNGHKDIENRDWKPWNHGLKFRGRVLIHAGKRMDTGAMDDLRQGVHPVTGDELTLDLPDVFELGGLIGEVDLVDCVTSSDSAWFVGPYGFVLRNPKPLAFRPCRGQLGFFHPHIEVA